MAGYKRVKTQATPEDERRATLAVALERVPEKQAEKCAPMFQPGAIKPGSALAAFLDGR